ncbi:MAG: Arginine--tRNA ligase [Parcubacteria group bacterium ADurb.Bin316]|nr:MAG: Arginine--tRNA ligase [Parcubacteria group bacterium ADurb.Bin316]HOZ55998.1 arginine--tRNA ligase [bacterium]
MYTLEKVKNEIVEKLNKKFGEKSVQVSDIVYPPDVIIGDLSLPCFGLSKKLSKAPAEVACMVVSTVKPEGLIKGIKAVGPYANFTLNKQELAKGAISEINKQGGKYGSNKIGRSKRVMLEFSNGNTHKELHVGHLRNICLGDSLTKILEANGFESIPVSYINDFGIHVAKTIWALQEFYKDEQLPENRGCFLGKIYVRACQELEKDSAGKATVNFIMKKIEERRGGEYKLWQETRKWSIEQFDKIYKDLGVDFQYTFYENEVIDKGKKVSAKLLKSGILEKSDGAVIANLEKYNLGVLVFFRSDGTATYPVADLALAEEKFKKFKIDKSIYIVDVRQALYFKQLFKILELMGYKKEMIHLGYEFLKLPTGMMSSRTGQVITFEELRDQIFAKAQEETKARHQEWDEEKINEVARILALGAMKFEMIKVGADQVITFDIEQALSFSGFTAAYLQYTYARLDSIIRKAGEIKNKVEYSLLTENKENEIVMMLAKFPETIMRAGKEYNPSEIAKYLFELAQMTNDYYHQIPVMKAEEDIKQARLSLISSVNQVIESGLEMLGVEILKEM